MATKKHLVKLTLPSEFLKTLPVFTPPKTKRVKKVASDDKKASNGSDHKGSSPAPGEENLTPKINTGPKELSTAGLTVSSVTHSLDKSGAPSKKWVRTTRQFKSFSGFKTKIKTWKQKPDTKKDVKIEKNALLGDSADNSLAPPHAEITAN